MINKFSILNGAKYFSSEMFQNYFVFITATKYIKYFSGTIQIDLLKSNRMSEENIQNIPKSDSIFSQTFVNYNLLSEINFNGHGLINNISIPKKVISLYISYTLNPQLTNLKTEFILGICLLRSVKLTANVDLGKYKYSAYDIEFDFRE